MEDTEEGFEIVQGIDENFQEESDDSERDSLTYMLHYLQRVAVENVETFQDVSDATRTRIHSVFCLLDHHLEGLEPAVRRLFDIAKDYDFNGLRANGYRSLLKILYKCCKHILLISEEITSGKDNLFLSLRSTYRDLESFVAYLGQLRSCCLHIVQIPAWSDDGCLFSRIDESLFSKEVEQLFSELEALNREPFYGRCLGHQFVKSMQNSLKMINVAMASFGESFHKDSVMNKWALSFMSSGKYFMNPELRAQQVVKTTQNSDIMFCKAFWNITETDLLQELPMIVCPPIQVSHAFEIETEPLRLPRADGSAMVDIPIPTIYHGKRAISARLISHVLREGQEQLMQKDMSPMTMEPVSRCLVVHCHGGGFVAQSSKSHEMYLRHWARGIGVPIFSIDYSLAPESPYPRAVDEIYYAYCWALDNGDLLGSTLDRICFVGDSCGANLVLATCLKAIQEGVRVPDGLLSIYGATYVHYAPSPSRLLAVMDPLLPVGVLTRCLAAYVGFDARDVFHSYLKKRREMNDGYLDPLVEEKLRQLEAANQSSEPVAPSGSTHSPNVATGKNSCISREEKSSEKGLERQVATDGHAAMATENGTAERKSKPPSEARSPMGTNPSRPPKRIVTSHSYPVFPEECISNNPSQMPDDQLTRVHLHSNGAINVCDDNLVDASRADSNDSSSASYHTVDGNSLSGHSVCTRKRSNSDGNSSSFDAIETSDLDLMSLGTDSSEATSPSKVDCDLDSKTFKFQSMKTEIGRGGASINPPSSARRASEITPRLSRGAPHRSASGPDLQAQAHLQDKYAPSFQWSSLVSPATKNKIRNNLTSIGNLMWGSGPNHCRKTTYHDDSAESVLNPDMNLPLHAYRYLPVPQDPLLSPYLASLDLLAKMPTVYLLACHLDPLLDDSIEFAKRLEQAGAEVHLDVLDDLPHGFLNFTLLSREAKMGCDTCIIRIRQILLHSPR